MHSILNRFSRVHYGSMHACKPREPLVN